MYKSLTKMLSVLALAALASNACALPLQWSGNGHSYEAFLADSTVWTDAKIAAESKGGYLATLTSTEENLWVYENIVYPMFSQVGQAWIGGFKQNTQETDPASGWSWVTGESWSYTNWGPGEPNNVGGVETGLTINRFEDATWNDEGSWLAGVKGYIVEYPSCEAVPDAGSSLALLTLGLACLSLKQRKNG
ncbi:MAG: hypothetical protein RI897_2396 [Verrucomicrobiota bacterium]|jgi:hypothetical protein